MFRIRAIQAEHGDALLVSYGDPERPRHILVDGGPAGTRDRLLALLKTERVDGKLCLEAVVVTHYDLDHIEGMIELLSVPLPEWLEIKDVWFNGHCHLRQADRLGASEGDSLSKLIRSRKLHWNQAFKQTGDTIQQSCEAVVLEGELEVRVLSPDASALKKLASEWTNPGLPPAEAPAVPSDRMGRKDPWPPGDFAQLSKSTSRSDRSAPNGSSIALLLKFGEKRMLLAADAFADVVKAGLALHHPLQEPIDLLKVSHHGSKANTDRELLATLRCSRFLISTSGKNHLHPDNELIARLIANGKPAKIFFNYDVRHTSRWRNKPQGWPSFEPVYPEKGEQFIEVLL